MSLSPPSPPRNLVREAGELAAARLGVRVVGVIVGLVVARVIGPEGLGQLALPNLLLAVAPFLSLGFADALVRELPMAAAQGAARLRALTETSWFAGLLAGLLLLAVAALYHAWPASHIRDPLMYWLAMIAGLSHLAFKIGLSTLTGTRRIRDLAMYQVLQGLSRAALVLLLLFLLPADGRVYALHAGVALSLVASVVWASRRGVVSWPRPEAAAVRRLWRSGPPMALASLFLMLLIVGDRLVMSRVLPLPVLGLYEQGVLIRDGLLLIPGVLLSVLLPDYASRSATPDARRELLADVSRQTSLMAVGTPVLLGLVALQLPWLLGLLLPRFVVGMPLFQLAVLAMCPVFLSYILVSLLISEGRAASVGLWAAASMAGVLLLDLANPDWVSSWLERVASHGHAQEGMTRALAGALAALAGFWAFTLAVLLGNARRLGIRARRAVGWLAPSMVLTLAALPALERGWIQHWNPATNLVAASAAVLLLWSHERHSAQLTKVWRARRAAKR